MRLLLSDFVFKSFKAAQAKKLKKNAHTRSRTEDLMIDFVLVMRFTTKPCELIGGSLFHICVYVYITPFLLKAWKYKRTF